MTTIEQNLTQYAAYHRDRRNIATHFVGVPMIVFAIVLALAVVEIPVGPGRLTLAAITSIAASSTTSSSTSRWGHDGGRRSSDVRGAERDHAPLGRAPRSASPLASSSWAGRSSSSATSTRA